MRDIYSPLEIDEEWDNFSPVDTAMAPAQEIQPVAPPKMIEVQDESKMPSPATQAAAAPPEGPTDTNFADTSNNAADTESNLNAGPQKDSTDPAWKAASDAISASPQNNDSSVNGNIADWMKNDNIPAYNNMENTKDNTDTLEIADTGAKPDVPANDNAVKVSVNSEPTTAPEVETQPDEDIVTPVVIDTTATPAESSTETAAEAEPKADTATEEEPKLGWEDGKDDTEKAEPAPETDTSEVDEAKAAYVT